MSEPCSPAPQPRPSQPHAVSKRAQERRSRFSYYLVAGIVGINLVAVAAALYFFAVSRQNEEEKFRIQASTVVHLLTQDIENEYEQVALSLQVLADEHAMQRALGPAQFAAWMQRSSQRHPAVNMLRIIDANGEVVFPPADGEHIPHNVADREYFIRLRDNPQAGLEITPPLLGRVSGKRVVVLARRLSDAQNRFSGVALAAIPTSYFDRLLAHFDLERGVQVGLFDPRYGWVARAPALSDQEGLDRLDLLPPLSEAIVTQPEGGFLATTVDGVDRSVAFRHSRTFDFHVALARRHDDYMAHWAETVRAGTVALALFALLTAACGLLVNRSWKQRSTLTTALLERDQWIRQAEQIGELGFYRIDIDADRWVATEAFDTITGIGPGYPRSSLGWLALVHPDDRDSCNRSFRSAAEARRDVVEMEYRIIRPADGVLRWISSAAQLMASDDGAKRVIVGVARDITEHMRAETLLRCSEAELRAAFEQAAVGISFNAPEGTFLSVNERLCDIVGYPKSELLGMRFQDITHPDDVAASVAQVARMTARQIDRFSMEKRYIRKDGSIVWANLTVSLISNDDGTPNHLVAIVDDIDERKRAERDLQRSRELLHNFLDHMPGFACIKDDSLRIVHASQSFREIPNLAHEQLIGRSNEDIFPGEFGARLTADDRRVLDSGQSEVVDETNAGRVYQSIRFVIPQEGAAPLLGAITRDVTHRHLLEQRVKVLLEINEIGSTLAEKELLAYGLEAAEKLTGSTIGFLHFVDDDQETLELSTWTAGALRDCSAAFDSRYPISRAGIWADSFREKQPVIVNDYASHATRHGLPEGHAPLARLISVPVIEAGAVHMLIGVGNKAADYDDFDVTTVQLIGNDLWRIVCRLRAEVALARRLAEVTELQGQVEQAHLQLVQAEKMSAIGQLAAGVAHELNNPIGFVYSNLGTLGEYADDLLAIDAAYARVEPLLLEAGGAALDEVRRIKNERDHDYLVDDLPKLIRESKEGLERVRQIVLDLKDFSRVGETDWQWADIEHGLDATINIVWNELKYKAEVARQYGTLPQVRCLPSQLNQVFMNLLVNAAQAIESHGHIAVRTGTDGSAATPESVWVEIEDNGRGMSPEVQKRLFEPFFTTKPVGEGTGLGLSISYGIIEKHHGRIDLRSAVGHGTTFRITLPIDGSQPRAETSAATPT